MQLVFRKKKRFIGRFIILLLLSTFLFFGGFGTEVMFWNIFECAKISLT